MTGRLLGAQIVGHTDAQVAKRIDIPAVAMFHELTVDGLNDLDLSYAPPFGSPWDAVQLAAQAWTIQWPGNALNLPRAEELEARVAGGRGSGA